MSVQERNPSVIKGGKTIVDGDQIGLHDLHVPVQYPGNGINYLEVRGDRGRRDFKGVDLIIKAEPRLTDKERAQKVSEDAWNRMQRARLGDFS